MKKITEIYNLTILTIHATHLNQQLKTYNYVYEVHMILVHILTITTFAMNLLVLQTLTYEFYRLTRGSFTVR